MKGIYCIENLDTSKKYYGSSMDVEWRLEQHRRGLRKGKHINVYLQRSYNLHGLDRFYFSLVEDMGDPTKKELQVREQWYIDNNGQKRFSISQTHSIHIFRYQSVIFQSHSLCLLKISSLSKVAVLWLLARLSVA